MQEPADSPIVVSIPISFYLSRQATPEPLHSLVAESLPERWTLTMVKLRVQHSDFPKVDVIVTLCVQSQLTWTLSVLNVSLDPSLNPALTCFNPTLSGASAVVSLLRAIDSLNCCVGNPDLKFLDLWKHRSSTLHFSSGNLFKQLIVPVLCCFLYRGERYAFIDDLHVPSTVRHNNCLLLVPHDKLRCSACITYRTTLSVQVGRIQQSSTCSPTNHTILH